jgi:hypothetical protein
MATVSVLEKLINFVYGAFIFLILIGVLFAVYHIFWADEPTIPEQNFGTVFEELKLLRKNTDFAVVIRPYEEDYDLFLYEWGNKAEGCGGRPCLCLDEKDKAMDCKVIPGSKRDCKKAICVSKQTSRHVVAMNSDPVLIFNKNNNLTLTVT